MNIRDVNDISRPSSQTITYFDYSLTLSLPSDEVGLEAGVLYDWHDDLLVVAEGAALGWVPDALDHLDALHLELVAVKHGGEDDVLAVALQNGARVAV